MNNKKQSVNDIDREFVQVKGGRHQGDAGHIYRDLRLSRERARGSFER